MFTKARAGQLPVDTQQIEARDETRFISHNLRACLGVSVRYPAGWDSGNRKTRAVRLKPSLAIAKMNLMRF